MPEPLVASLLDPLSGDFGLLSALEMLVVGGSCGAVGVWVVTFGRAFLAESFTHALLPGLVLAALAGASLLAGALAGVVLAFVVALSASKAPRTTPSTATSLTVTLLVGGGALLATTGDSSIALENLLFGDPLAASEADIAIGLTLAAVIATALWLLHGSFTATAFDRGAATALGIRVGRVETALLGLLVVAVVVSANIAGSLLALALVTGPAVGAVSVCSRIGHAVALATIAGAACGVGGIFLSYYADWPASASIALLASFAAPIIGLAAALGRRLGRPLRHAVAQD
ncbi:MAG: metal ABC transporter permease [Solirubrobacterales bacterium]